ncbi:hypothetical protein D3C83_43630 [compost metagenome]
MMPTMRPLTCSASIASATTASVSPSSVPNPSSMNRLSMRTTPAERWICSLSSSASASDARNVSPPLSVSAMRRSRALS